jgi:enediyne biosynthesis protein E4
MASRGIALGDADRDGDLDLAVANQWQPPVFYRNDAPGPGAHLGLRLLRLPNRPAIGASAAVHLTDGRVLVQQVDGGNGHSGRRVPELLFGLGSGRGRSVLVDLAWRDRAGTVRRQRLGLAAGWHTIWLDTNATRRVTAP